MKKRLNSIEFQVFSFDYMGKNKSQMFEKLRFLCVVLCGSPKPNLPERTRGLPVYFPCILGHAPENRVGTLKAYGVGKPCLTQSGSRGTRCCDPGFCI